jgi:hypothetical protein
VWVRVHGAGRDERVVFVHVGDRGAIEVARHRRAEPGSPQIDDAHFPPAPAAIRAGEDKSLTQGTAGWAALGATATGNPPSATNRDNGSHQNATDQQATDQHDAPELEDNR